MGQRSGMGFGGGRFISGGNLILSGIMLVILLVILGCVIYLVVQTAKNAKKGMPLNNNQDDSSESLKILDGRFAKGEITEEEYKAKKELILKR